MEGPGGYDRAALREPGSPILENASLQTLARYRTVTSGSTVPAVWSLWGPGNEAGVTIAAGREYGIGAEGSQRTAAASAATGRAVQRGAPSAPTPVPLTIEAAVERLGVTPRLVRRLVIERRTGFVRVGKVLGLRPEDLDAYIEEHFEPPLERRASR